MFCLDGRNLLHLTASSRKRWHLAIVRVNSMAFCLVASPSVTNRNVHFTSENLKIMLEVSPHCPLFKFCLNPALGNNISSCTLKESRDFCKFTHSAESLISGENQLIWIKGWEKNTSSCYPIEYNRVESHEECKEFILQTCWITEHWKHFIMRHSGAALRWEALQS
jgi:hypothetical protein